MDTHQVASFANFGTRELNIAAQLLTEFTKNPPEYFSKDGIAIQYNTKCGKVYLTNTEHEIVMLNPEGKLEPWLDTPYHGNEGFLTDILMETRVSRLNSEDVKFLKGWAKVLGREDEFLNWAVNVSQCLLSENWMVETPHKVQNFKDELAAHEWARLTREELKSER